MFVEDGNGGNAFDAALSSLPALYNEMMESASLADQLRVEVITFDDKAVVIVPLSDMAQLNKYLKEFKEIVPGEEHTYYGEAFSTLRTEIEKGVQQLQADGYEVYRPVVFFITDGEPNDDDSARNKSYSDLTTSSFSYRPNLICVGVGKATKESLKEYGASGYKYDEYTTGNEHVVLAPSDGITPAKAVMDIIPVLIRGINNGTTSSSPKTGDTPGFFGEPIFDDLDDEWT
jgi:uncharacterized protein YegL